MDITLCTDTKCPSRKQCLRYAGNHRKADKAFRQSYGDFNRPEELLYCEAYEPIEEMKTTG